MIEKVPSRSKPRRWWLAGLLSMLQPGLGQIYNGQALKGIGFFIVVLVLAIPVSILLIKYASIYTHLIVLILALGIWAAFVADAIVYAKKRGATYSLKPYNRVLVYVAIAVALFLVRETDSSFVRACIVQSFKIPAASMAPTLLAGDYILVDKLHNSERCPNRGDVVVFKYPVDPTKEFIKRVEAIEGDFVEIKNKSLYLNGKLVKADYAVFSDNTILPAQTAPRDNFGPATVPKDSIFVLGDNRDHSLDSRFFGFVDKSKITGIAKYIYFSWDSENSSIRWNRMGGEIR